MDSLFVLLQYLVIPFLISFCAGILVLIVTRPTQIYWKPLISGIAAGTILLMVIIAILPPYDVTNVRWCKTQNENELLIRGRIVRSLVRTSVSNQVVQLKVFRAGGTTPIYDAVFPTSDYSGNFETKISSTTITPNKLYLINTAYNFDSFFKKDRWKIEDFRAGIPRPCEDL